MECCATRDRVRCARWYLVCVSRVCVSRVSSSRVSVGRPVARALVAVLAVSLVLVACGSDNKTSAKSRRRAPTTSAAPTGQTTRPDVTAAPGSDPVIAAAGDIACPSACTSTKTVADMLVAGDYTAVLTLGDNQYEDGRLSEYKRSYDPTWGRVKDKTFPSPGNHDYHDADGADYYSYFGPCRAAGQGLLQLRHRHVAPVEPEQRGEHRRAARLGRSRPRRQSQPLHARVLAQADLDLGQHPPPRRRAHDAHLGRAGQGADVVLNGHVHNYERFAPRDGIREFIVGTGGRDSHYGFAATAPLSEVRDNSTDGLLRLTLHPAGYDWRFLPVPGGTFSDAGSGSCA